jgi:hypothetical protein
MENEIELQSSYSRSRVRKFSITPGKFNNILFDHIYKIRNPILFRKIIRLFINIEICAFGIHYIKLLDGRFCYFLFSKNNRNGKKSDAIEECIRLDENRLSNVEEYFTSMQKIDYDSGVKKIVYFTPICNHKNCKVYKPS